MYENFCIYHIGLDDFDLLSYGCTTHVATYLLHSLAKRFSSIVFIDYPNLVRLNPSIPWKTRGNGAIAIRIAMECTDLNNLLEAAEDIIDEYYEKYGVRTKDVVSSDREPGLVVVRNGIVNDMGSLYITALTDVLLPEIVKKKIDKYGRENIVVSKRYCGRGIVGAAASVGWIAIDSDYTYELLVYRSEKFYSLDRCVNEESVKYFDSITKDRTFNNIDVDSNRILITSHGRDPILYGVRGEDPEVLLKALDIIRVCEPISSWTIFRTNQATDAHAIDRSVSSLRVYRTGKIRVTISSKPSIGMGGTVIINGFDATGSITLAFFRPSYLNRYASMLIPGDVIEANGHVKPWNIGPVFHVEKFSVLKLAPLYRCKAPRCPYCRKRLTKMGRGKGYKCDKCGYSVINPDLECEYIERKIRLGLYIPPPRALKHLIKPIERYGKEKYRHRYPIELKLSQITKILETSI
ncbi:tRNA(Ile2) 2-agmatinylcytidine synthetase [Ignisphaera aggregans DSM 17230]|uniref:tRNA(Ile2) 2-agmatinylcytidine synthetase TiaS n=1 Tax=Ignisphaera aggregans (strain DSM 17230 / JCM 13409 / AQ1.S1) TaxID=583356 RepID=TIAS_IGNAA|nr:RecName: Full=tRNA(Ile2) 2-agmatinylcytidine synthetase TiaS; Short=tRNA(Ile2)-agm2C synthetase; AltName: Full=tRNA(Ile2) agmatidine synthetase [Ignisphaera aggregans DSM 17230]ADM26908.1 tRNA(Ile2) 2-agmatinylcytidine synthetase [Ignisphaera aggregans DSM 17230]